MSAVMALACAVGGSVEICQPPLLARLVADCVPEPGSAMLVRAASCLERVEETRGRNGERLRFEQVLADASTRPLHLNALCMRLCE